MKRLKTLSGRWLLRLIGVVLLILVLSKVDVARSVNVLVNVDKGFYALAVLLLGPKVLIRGRRWQLILQDLGIHYPFTDSFLACASGLLLGVITPGRLGEFARALYLKREGYLLGKPLSSILLERLLDLAMVASVGTIGLAYLTLSQDYQGVFVILVSLIVIGIVTGALLVNKRGAIFAQITARLTPGGMSEKVESLRRAIADFSRKASWASLYELAFWTIVFWFLHYVQVYILALSLGVKVSFFYLTFCTAVVTFVNALPISISGIGTRDVTLVYLLGRVGITSEKAVVLSFLILSILVMHTMLGFLAWLKKPLPLSAVADITLKG